MRTAQLSSENSLENDLISLLNVVKNNIKLGRYVAFQISDEIDWWEAKAWIFASLIQRTPLPTLFLPDMRRVDLCIFNALNLSDGVIFV